METLLVNFILFRCLLRSLKKSSNSFREWAHTRKMSFIYLTQSVGVFSLLFKNASSNCPIYMVASEGANLVPIARPHVWVKTKSLNLNTLFFSMYFSRSSWKTFCGWFLKIFRKDIIASSWLMFVYRLSMSSVIRYASVGILVLSRRWIRLVEFLK